MVSAGASQKIFRPSLSEMLPRWQTAVEVWPVSTSLMHRARDLTHLRKSCTWGQFWSQLPPHFGSNGVLHSKQERGGQAAQPNEAARCRAAGGRQQGGEKAKRPGRKGAEGRGGRGGGGGDILV